MVVIHLCSHGFMHESDLESEHVIPVVFAIHIKKCVPGASRIISIKSSVTTLYNSDAR